MLWANIAAALAQAGDRSKGSADSASQGNTSGAPGNESLEGQSVSLTQPGVSQKVLGDDVSSSGSSSGDNAREEGPMYRPGRHLSSGTRQKQYSTTHQGTTAAKKQRRWRKK
jgi:hypothetical protein